MPRPPGQPTFALKITLQEITPAIWRRLLVPGSVRLDKLHLMFQAAMGWTNSHLHSFTVADSYYGMHFDDWPEDEIDEKEVTVLQAIRDHKEFVYQYDFGDNWEHDVVVEDITWPPHGLRHAVCLAGANACPPEDVGGRWRYKEFLEALTDPTDEDHKMFIEWIGGSFDATAFDLAGLNAALQKLRLR